MQLRKNPPIVESFAKIVQTWVMDGAGNIRYRRPCDFDAKAAERFLACAFDPKKESSRGCKKRHLDGEGSD